MSVETIPDLFIFGCIFLLGWLAHVISSRAHIPRVTILLSIGVVAGPAVLDLVPPSFTQHFSTVTHLALAMIGFLLGESFAGRDIMTERRQIFFISLGASLIPATAVFSIVFLVTSDLTLSLVLAGIATATDPAATVDVIREFNARGPVSRILKGVVAVDDAWGIIIFSLLLVAATATSSTSTNITDILHGIWDVLGALLLGVVIGLPMSAIIGRHKPGEPTIIEAMGFVFICGGSALYFDVSYLLACMMLGATVAHKGKHIKRPFHDIETASDPFLIIFFILSGMSLDLSAIDVLGAIGVLYVLARCIGKILGAQVFAHFAQSSPQVTKYLGWCLLPQAGVAIGMALLVGERLPDIGESVLTIAVTTTVFFELLGPLVTRWSLYQAGEISK
ncbi:cation:proton antiporter [Photobacterium lutimaris]|uniref:Sodium:proton exchanger n=1 Tax=Photobacterium lutimaris TaxID=388278 RepID=A0A2T3J507_9GAMM|nr:cation:proton antiporter [Photobacterium lutimaris]PSU36364.1 sodium:proton exchanger [Photobacterium lutimaris]TDR74740.1 transporter (CPA2 family) [Photobacterium lutimaris]